MESNTDTTVRGTSARWWAITLVALGTCCALGMVTSAASSAAVRQCMVSDDTSVFQGTRYECGLVVDRAATPVDPFLLGHADRNSVDAGIDSPCVFNGALCLPSTNHGHNIREAVTIAAEDADDCNGNGVPDDIDLALRGTYNYTSSIMLPFMGGSTTTVALPTPQPALDDVYFVAWASADLDSPDEYVDVYLNAEFVGSMFGKGYRCCPGGRDVDVLSIPQSTFNAALSDGITFSLTPSHTVTDCEGRVQIRVFYAAGSKDCNGNGVPDECDIREGNSADCNGNGVPDECESEGEPFPAVLSENTTGFSDICFLGPPDGVYRGIGGQVVTYAMRDGAIVDESGPDLNVYECDRGRVEFGEIDVLVSCDGVHFVSIAASESPVVRIPGDETHGNDAFARSYDLGPSGLDHAFFVRIDGAGEDVPGPITGFDLDGIGVIHMTGLDTNGNGVPDDCECPGDFNGDGTVDETDLGTLLYYYQADRAVYPMGDIDCDGDVDLEDLAATLSYFGTSCGMYQSNAVRAQYPLVKNRDTLGTQGE